MAESLRDQLEANLDKIVTVEESTHPVADTTPSPEPAAATPSGGKGAAPESKVGEDTRARDDKGRFAEKKDEPAAKAKAAPAAPVAAPVAAAPALPTAPAKPAPQRPSSWKKDYWPHWDKLTSGGALSPQEASALAEYMGQRESDFQHGVSTYKREWETARPVMEAIAPYLPLLQQHGIAPQAWVSNLGAAHRELALGAPQQKLARFAWLAQQYGVPVQALVDEGARNQYLASAPAQAQAQPQPQGLTVAQAKALWQQEFIAHTGQQEIERFAADKENHPHFEILRETMAQLLEAGLAKDLQSAEAAALRLPQHSELWQQIQEQDRATKDEATRAAEADRVAKAKGKAVSVRSSTPSAPSGEKPKDRRSQIEEAFDSVVGGARL